MVKYTKGHLSFVEVV